MKRNAAMKEIISTWPSRFLRCSTLLIFNNRAPGTLEALDGTVHLCIIEHPIAPRLVWLTVKRSSLRRAFTAVLPYVLGTGDGFSTGGGAFSAGHGGDWQSSG